MRFNLFLILYFNYFIFINLYCQQLLQHKFHFLHSHFSRAYNEIHVHSWHRLNGMNENSFDYMLKRVLEFPTFPHFHLPICTGKVLWRISWKNHKQKQWEGDEARGDAKSDWLRQNQHWVMESDFPWFSHARVCT